MFCCHSPSTICSQTWRSDRWSVRFVESHRPRLQAPWWMWRPCQGPSAWRLSLSGSMWLAESGSHAGSWLEDWWGRKRSCQSSDDSPQIQDFPPVGWSEPSAVLVPKGLLRDVLCSWDAAFTRMGRTYCKQNAKTNKNGNIGGRSWFGSFYVLHRQRRLIFFMLLVRLMALAQEEKWRSRSKVTVIREEGTSPTVAW